MQRVTQITEKETATAECTQSSFDFPACTLHKIQADFNGGDITSDGDSLLLRQVDIRVAGGEVHRLLQGSAQRVDSGLRCD